MKNQFRTLDEDEVEFLDSLLESTRAREAALKKETNEQLEVFHRQRQEAEKAALDSGDTNDPNRVGAAASPTEDEQWSIPGRKRRRVKEKDALPGVKLRKSSSDTKSATNNVEAKPAAEKAGTPKSSVVGPKNAVNSKESSTSGQADKVNDSKPTPAAPPPTQTSSASAPPPVSSALGLVAYDSDED